MPLESERSIIGDLGDPDQPQPNFAMQLSVLGSIKGLQEDIDMLSELMGSRKNALRTLQSKQEFLPVEF